MLTARAPEGRDIGDPAGADDAGLARAIEGRRSPGRRGPPEPRRRDRHVGPPRPSARAGDRAGYAPRPSVDDPMGRSINWARSHPDSPAPCTDSGRCPFLQQTIDRRGSFTWRPRRTASAESLWEDDLQLHLTPIRSGARRFSIIPDSLTMVGRQPTARVIPPIPRFATTAEMPRPGPCGIERVEFDGVRAIGALALIRRRRRPQRLLRPPELFSTRRRASRSAWREPDAVPRVEGAARWHQAQLWNASIEAASFHEAFGDISAILSALDLPSVREDVLATQGQVSRRRVRGWRSSSAGRSASRTPMPSTPIAATTPSARSSPTEIYPWPPRALSSELTLQPVCRGVARSLAGTAEGAARVERAGIGGRCRPAPRRHRLSHRPNYFAQIAACSSPTNADGGESAPRYGGLPAGFRDVAAAIAGRRAQPREQAGAAAPPSGCPSTVARANSAASG
jgi:hypothetical protein